jgi:hypothetical protein
MTCYSFVVYVFTYGLLYVGHGRQAYNWDICVECTPYSILFVENIRLFPNYNRLPNLTIIKESQMQYIYIFVCIFIHICVYSFHMCYIRFGAYPNHMLIQKIVKKKLVGKERKK